MIPSEDIEISIINPRLPGGQQVGSVNYIIKVLHKPTGIEISSGMERSQLRNREFCMKMLEEQLIEIGYIT